MSDYAHAIDVHAPADELFDFLSDVSNLPQYLPSTEQLEPIEGDRLRVRGRADGRPYAGEGFCRIDRRARRMEWGCDGEHMYRGKLEVKDSGPRQSTVRVYLAFDATPSDLGRFERRGVGDRRVVVQQGLERALRAVKNLVERHGPGVHSAHAAPARHAGRPPGHARHP